MDIHFIPNISYDGLISLLMSLWLLYLQYFNHAKLVFLQDNNDMDVPVGISDMYLGVYTEHVIDVYFYLENHGGSVANIINIFPKHVTPPEAIYLLNVFITKEDGSTLKYPIELEPLRMLPLKMRFDFSLNVSMATAERSENLSDIVRHFFSQYTVPFRRKVFCSYRYGRDKRKMCCKEIQMRPYSHFRELLESL